MECWLKYKSSCSVVAVQFHVLARSGSVGCRAVNDTHVDRQRLQELQMKVGEVNGPKSIDA